MTNCKYKLRKLSIGLVSVGTMFMAAPVMGEDASQPTASVTTESPAIQTEEDQGSQAEALEEPTPAPQTSPSTVSAVPAEAAAMADEKGIAEAPAHEPAPKASVQAEAASPAGKAEATTNTGQPTNTEQARSRSKRAAEIAPQTIEVEKLEVDKENSSLTVKDGEKDKQLIKHRDGNQRDIFDISRDVKVNQDGTMDVTLTVKPKQIDEGAEVIVLLDTSQKMTETDFNTAKENIKKLVTTLTGTTDKEGKNVSHYNNRNSVRLIDFYRKVGESTDLSGWDAKKIDEKLNEVWKKAKDDYNGWGVDLQGAIHKAREIFNLDKEKRSGKRQHIVLFSQGESTFSYDIKDKSKMDKVAVEEPVTYSNPLFPWPFYFDTTTRTHNVVNDAKKLIDFLNKLGISQFNGAVDNVATVGNTLLGLGSFFGLKNPLDYISLADLETSKLNSEKFDYSRRVGEGYNFRSYFDREVDKVGFKKILVEKIKGNLKKFQPKQTDTWLSSLGLNSIKEKIQDWMIDKALDNLFYRRQYQFYNHNLSAQAEARMAREEGIKFYAVDVTEPERIAKEINSQKYSEAYTNHLKKKAEEARELAKKRNEKFDKYLKEMSESQKFFKDVEDPEKFKDILTELKVTETFEEKVSVNNSEQRKSNKEVEYKKASSNSSFLSFIFSSSTNESITWTLSKDKLQKALQSGETLTLEYKLKIHKDKFKLAPQTRSKRSLDTSENKKSVTEKVITSDVKYKINDKEVKGKKLDDVSLTYSKETVRKPQVEPNVPDTPQEKPLTPLAPSEPSVPETSTPEGPTEGENNLGGQSEEITITEDSQSGMSGQNPGSGNETVVEDTQTSQEDEVIIGGQGQVIDFTEDTQTGMSGAGQVESPTITEETHKPEIIMGGQSDPIDMVEDTLPGMSGSNEATVVEEDTRPKLQFHFDNEEPVPATVPTVSQTPIAQVESKVPHAKAESALPQTGDTNKLETFFTITALTVIGAAGLLGKKRRNNQTD